MQGCCIRAGGAIAAHCLGWQSEAPGQQHWRTTPCAVGNSCVLPTARHLQHRRAQRLHGADRGGVLRLPPHHPRPLSHADAGGCACAGHACGPSKAGGALALCHFLARWAHPASSAAPCTMPPAPCPLHVQDKDDGSIITFCTGVRAGSTLMPMWCAAACLAQSEGAVPAHALAVPAALQPDCSHCPSRWLAAAPAVPAGCLHPGSQPVLGPALCRFIGAAPTTTTRRAGPAPPTSTCCTRCAGFQNARPTRGAARSRAGRGQQRMPTALGSAPNPLCHHCPPPNLMCAVCQDRHC